MAQEKRASWSGQLAFVLATAASAIGLGNLWRFPYLAAQYGGAAFIATYFVLFLILGVPLMITEISLGRLTRRSQVSAYGQLHPRWKGLGFLATVVPFLVTPYYCAIGGWVLKYFMVYLKAVCTGESTITTYVSSATAEVGADAFFADFISSPLEPVLLTIIFVFIAAGVILLGVKNGIEKANLVMMPILLLAAILLAGYVVSMPGTGAGLKYYLIPDFQSFCDTSGHVSLALVGKTILGAMGQMFYSLSIAMGILVTYGSYMRREDSIGRSVLRVGLCDTLVAFLSGLTIVPMVYLFAVQSGVTPEVIAAHGGDVAAAEHAAAQAAMNQGAGLMFITLPKVFATLGAAGPWIGLSFFLLVTFAAATSAISIYEPCVAALRETFGLRRSWATATFTFWTIVLGALSALGFGPLRGITLFGKGLLEFFDFVTNSVLMPVLALLTCVFIGWVVRPDRIISECEADGRVMRTRKFYRFAIRYLAPILVLSIIISEVCRVLGIGGWSI